MKSMRRTISIILVAATLLSSAIMLGCSDTTVNEKTDAGDKNTESIENTEQSTEQLSDYELRQLIADDLPERDFNGQEFRVAIESDKEFEILSEELTGEGENDAVYDRNVRIEDRFGCKIVSVITTEPFNAVKKIAQAGDWAYEICGHLDYKAYTPISAGAYVNWYDIPNVNLTKPWYSQLSNDSATMNGKIFCVTGDLAITTLLYTYGVFFNQRLCSEYGYTNDVLYQMVRDGTWTIDKFIEMCTGIYIDANGNATRDKDDIYGYGCFPCNPSDVWLTSFDQPLSGRDANGNIDVSVIMTEKTVDALQKIVDFTFNCEGHFKYATQWDEQIYFPQGNLAFAPLAFNNCFNSCREMADPYGILPNPKWDEAQEQYLTNAYDQFTVFGVPTSVPEDQYEFVGTIYEALNAESYKTVFPAYYDVALKGKYSEDRDTAEMVDIIMEGRLFDFSFQFGESSFSRLPYWFRDLLAANNANFQKKYDATQKALNKLLAKLYTYYE